MGLLLTIAPWMGWLQQNYFADRLAWLRAAMNMPAWRVLVVITGLITVLVGMADVWQAVGQRLARGRQPDA